MEVPDAQPSVGELINTLVGETGVLVRQELALARAEMTIKARAVAVSTSMIIVGAGVALAALLGAGATAIVALEEAIPLWAACLSVTTLGTVLAAGLVSAGLSRLRAVELLPQQTIASLQELSKLPSRSTENWRREDAQ